MKTTSFSLRHWVTTLAVLIMFAALCAAIFYVSRNAGIWVASH